VLGSHKKKNHSKWKVAIMLEVLDVFNTHAFLAKLDRRDRMALLTGAQPFRVQPGQTLASQGAPADHFFLIQQGEVDLESANHDAPVRVQRLGPGDVIGWSWLVEPHRWQFSCRALSDVQGIKFDAFWLRTLCESDHELGFHLTKYLLQVVAIRLTALRLAYQDQMAQRRAQNYGEMLEAAAS
jgi:CRP-like cAMP-binding protein